MHVLVRTGTHVRLVPTHAIVGCTIRDTRIVAYHEDTNTIHLEGGKRIDKDQYDDMDELIDASKEEARQCVSEDEYVSHPVAGEGRVVHAHVGCIVMDTNDGVWVVSCNDATPLGKMPIVLRNIAIELQAADNCVLYMPPVICSTGAMGFARQLIGAIATLGITYTKLPVLCDKGMPVRVLAAADTQTLGLRGGEVQRNKATLNVPLSFDVFSPNVMSEATLKSATFVTRTMARIHAVVNRHLTRWPEVLPIDAYKLVSGICPKAKKDTVCSAIDTFPNGMFEVNAKMIRYVRPKHTLLIYPLPAETPYSAESWIVMRKSGHIIPEMHTPFMCRKCYNRGGECCTSNHIAHRFVKHTTQGQYMFVTCTS